MKTIAAILLSGFYLAMSLGIPISAHYCHGEMVSLDVFTEATDSCCPVEPTIKGCCDIKTVVLLDAEEKIIQNLKNRVSHLLIAGIILETDFEAIADKAVTLSTFEYAQPPPHVQPVYLLNCSLTFYG